MPEKVRSPSFPFISLPEAIQRARLLYEAERRNPVSADVAVAHWGYAPKSSGGRQTIAALKAFELMEDVNGRLRLTDVGQHLVVREPGSPEHNVLLRQVALSPPLFRKLWDRYGPELPPPQSLRSYLVLELKLNENAVENLMRSYRETVAAISTAPAPDSPEDLALRFPLGELRVLRRLRSDEEKTLRTLFELWLEQIREKPGEGT
jgi:hypothetical protein